MPDHVATWIAPALLGAVVFGASIAWRSARSRAIPARWAQSRGLRIIHRQRRVLRTGPYVFRVTDGQVVFRVTVVNKATGGNRRAGFVRVGRWWVGLLADVVDVRWD